MSNKPNSTVATMGIDIGKNSFHVVGLDQRGTLVHSRLVAVRPMLSGMHPQAKRAEYSLAIKSRGKPPNPWRWEIHRAGRSSAVAQSSEFFPTMGAALRAGKQALADLFEKQQIRE